MTASTNFPRITFSVSIVVVSLALSAPNANAQETTFTSPCSIVGNAAPEPIGDREGHAIFVEEDVCRFDSGPFAGGVMTSTSTWEFEKSEAVLISSSAVFENPAPSPSVAYRREESF